MYMLVEFLLKNKQAITRTEVIEIANIKTKNLTNEEITSCEAKANSLCKKGEKVLGWKIIESYEINKEVK